MTADFRTRYMNRLLGHLIELLDIPPSHYRQATERYRSLSDWFHRDGSRISHMDPSVYSQGSFRLGTVIRPLTGRDEYDLDLVCQLFLLMTEVSQREVKSLVGAEIQDYSTAKGFKEPASEKKRCWRLNYADEISFHMDILPAVPDNEEFKRRLIQAGVDRDQAVLAVAITDTRHPDFQVITPAWPRSNPAGFARWFEIRTADQGLTRSLELVRNRAYASVEEVPAYEWKTPLQRAIQILKRHRDVMFQDDPDGRPISMIITSLSAHAYAGETELYPALSGILERMPTHISSALPRVPNPVNPAEDFADAWRFDPRLEDNFWNWHTQACADLHAISERPETLQLQSMLDDRFGVRLFERQIDDLAAMSVAVVRPVERRQPTVIQSAPQPWRKNV